METTLKIALLQIGLFWQNPLKNREEVERMLENLQPDTALIVLPEMFTTGFTMEAQKVAETMNGSTVNWLLRIAQVHNVAITGSIIIKEKEAYFNRLVFVQPNGQIAYYDKRHLFTLAQEHQNFSPGKEIVCITYQGWKIKPLICYDLRFPVWSRNAENYDMLLYVANWPKPRMHAWDTLLQARAIENLCYVAGVNRIGQDAKGHTYIGHSAVYDMLGDNLTPKNEENKKIIYATLDKSKLAATRTQLSFLEDGDSFQLDIAKST